MGWIWHLCLANMKQRGIRTGLTILGVVIGIISIVSLLAIGLGVKKEILDAAESEGSITEIRVYGISEGIRKDQMLTDRKIEEFREIEGVAEVYPVLNLSTYVRYKQYSGYWSIEGVPRNYLQQVATLNGTAPDENSLKPELIMGNQVIDFMYNRNTGVRYGELHDDEDEDEDKEPLDLSGEYLEVQFEVSEDAPSYRLTIADMTKEESYMIYCDIETLKKYLKQIADGGKVPGQPRNQNDENYREWIYDTAIVKVEDVDSVDSVVKSLKDMGYQVENNKEYVDSIQRMVKIAQVVLGGIGMIALVVAIIGIGNTMTTAVYDRINEIGVLKVLGSDPDELLYLFLLESGILGGLGGIIGILISYGITELLINQLVVKLMKMPKGSELAIIPVWLAVLAFFLAIVLGVLAGFFPARWAARLKPIDAVKNH